MDTIDIINIILGVIGVLVGLGAHVRINLKDKNHIGKLSQVANGDNNQQAGRDILK